MINFEKYQGTGNDFILIDNRNCIFTGNKVDFARKWCDRKFGVGADGLIFIEQSHKHDFKMDFFNPDGTQSFCGNGSRCAIAFAKKIGVELTNLSFEAIDGPHKAEINNGLVKIQMSMNGDIEKIKKDFYLNTGSPHYISYCKGLPQKNIVEFGKDIRYNDRFKTAGTNVNLVEILGENKIAVRTYERGVEDETLACGTGATASALTFAFAENLSRGKIDVQVQGGQLGIYFEQDITMNRFQNIWLEGPAEYVFKGELNG